MALYNFILYIFLILIVFLISAIIRSDAEDEKWVDFLKEIAIQTKLEFIRNNGSAYPFLAGKYFERSIKLEFLNIGGYEGVLPRIGLCITIELKKSAPSSMKIKRRDFFHNDQTAICESVFAEKYIFSSTSDVLLGKILEMDKLGQQLARIDFDYLTIEEKELKVLGERNETTIELLYFFLRSLSHLATLAESETLSPLIIDIQEANILR